MPKSEAKRRSDRARMVRVRREGKPRAPTAIRSCREVAAILAQRGIANISGGRVEQIEFAALIKLRQGLADLAGEVEPGPHDEHFATRQIDAAGGRLLASMEVSCDG